ncbi:GNAT family N-acetyltransferase [uncultured Tateyamaria sp.]|uniref:GNAT family N-acetyltransferase n=1 Tax=uncultured Tateyamaria sp. TaxID=455651 RepID=UPI00261D5BA3|nr:GNAT family N-acetyltransferase [uncultured Tateyamaria sp.]
MSWVIAQTDDLATCLELRRVVFMKEQGVSEADERDGRDGDALHVLATRDGVALGCARILVAEGVAKIGRVCVLQEARGTGLGAAIITACLDVARAQPGVTRAKLGAQIHALAFYEKLGFTAFGPVYDDAGIPHRDMDRDL